MNLVKEIRAAGIKIPRKTALVVVLVILALLTVSIVANTTADTGPGVGRYQKEINNILLGTDDSVAP